MGSLTDQTPVPGPAGYFYADVPNRTIAFVIDFIIIFVGLIVLAIVIGAIFPAVTLTGPFLFEPNPAFALVYGLLALLFSAGYFVYTWVAMRGTPGMKVLGMQVGHETDGRTLTYQEAIVRYALLFGPFIVADILGRFAAGLGTVLWLLGIVWFIVLLVTTAQSLTKQGLHDRYARSMVVKAGRAVG